jgi:hypothetical protein
VCTTSPRSGQSSSHTDQERWRRHAAELVRHGANLEEVAATFERLGRRRHAATARRLRAETNAILNELAREADRR